MELADSAELKDDLGVKELKGDKFRIIIRGEGRELKLRAPTAARASRHSQFEAPTEGGAASPQATNSSPPPAEPTAADAPCEEVLEALAI